MIVFSPNARGGRSKPAFEPSQDFCPLLLSEKLLLGGLGLQGSIDFAAEKFVVGVEFQRALVSPHREVILAQFKEDVPCCDRTIDLRHCFLGFRACIRVPGGVWGA